MKKQKLLITIFTLLVVVVGVSFAYFLLGAKVTGNGSTGNAETAELIKVVYDAKDNNINGTLLPGNSLTKEIDVKITPGSDELNKEAIYNIYLDIESNNFEKCTEQTATNKCIINAKELSYRVEEDGEDITPEDNDLTGKQGKVRLVKVIKKDVQEEVTYHYTIKITFEDTGADQNHNAKKSFSAKVNVEFAEEVDPKEPSEETLAKLELSSQGPVGAITGPSCNGEKDEDCYSLSTYHKNNMAQNGVFSAEDDFGTSYVFRGFVQNNWVKFGQEDGEDLWWRIIRVNGNGTIRLIYSGKGSSASTTGTGTQIATNYSDVYSPGINQQYNADSGDNTYVGFMYGSTGQTKYDDTHKNNAKSTIMTELETWYKKTTLGSLSSKIDINTGFCNDRGLSAGNHGSYLGPTGGYNQVQTTYAPYDRLLEADTTIVAKEQKPTLKCGKDATAQKRDLFTGPSATPGGTDGKNGKVEGNGKLSVPVGLITSDEVVFGGGFMYHSNNGYWLYTNQNYWTMSPYHFNGSTADVFFVGNDGTLSNYNVDDAYGVRPVINLKADTKIEFQDPSGANKGTTSNPYIVK